MTIQPVFMKRALQLAALGRLSVSPNPMVGCVIVRDGQIVGEGYHQRAGEPHAERHALKMAGQAAQGATAYISLEPCCHYGRTPPCTQALIEAGIKKVVIACLDPNPIVAGNGIAELQAANIAVEIGVLEAEATELNAIFFHYQRTRQPYIIAKWAMSLDGKTITHPGDDRSITSIDSIRHVHETRQQVDAILIGKNTAIHDNPLLTVRHTTSAETIRQPVRIVLTTNGNIPLDLHLLKNTDTAKTIIVTTSDINATQQNVLIEKGATVLIVNKNSDGLVDLHHLLTLLGEQYITSILVEGGRTVHESFFKAGLVNKIDMYLAPVIIGHLPKKIHIKNMHHTAINQDYLFSATCDNNYEE